MPSPYSQWTGTVSTDDLAQLSEATATVRDEVHLAVNEEEVILAARSEDNKCCVVGSTPILRVNTNHMSIGGEIKMVVNADKLTEYCNSFNVDVCEFTIVNKSEEAVKEVIISDNSLTVNATYPNKRVWNGTFSEPEYEADFEIEVTQLVSGVNLLAKVDPGKPEHVLLCVNDQVMYAYAWGDLDELLLRIPPSKVYTCSAPFHSVYSYNTLLSSLSAFETDSPVRVRLAPETNFSNWAVGKQAKFEAVDTDYDLTLWVKPQHKPTEGSPPQMGKMLLNKFKDQDTISQADLASLSYS